MELLTGVCGCWAGGKGGGGGAEERACICALYLYT